MRFNRYKTTFFLQTLYISLVIITVALIFFLIKIHPLFFTTTKPSLVLIIDRLTNDFSPQPVEKFVFLTLVVLIPIITFVVLVFSSSSRINICIKKLISSRLENYFIPILYSTIIYSPFFQSNLYFNIIDTTIRFYSLPKYSLLFFSLITTIICFLLTRKFRFQTVFLNLRMIYLINWIIFILLVLLQIFSWRLIGVTSVTRNSQWSIHADTVYYVISQVVSGKTLLVDLPSQYGLYPEFLAPIFKVVKLTILSLSSVFAILQLASLSGLYYVLSKSIKSKLLWLLSGLTLILMTFGSYNIFSGNLDPYYQYWPIRFVWPAFSVVMFYRFSSRKTLTNSLLFSLSSSLSMLWNLDTGLFIWLTFAIYLTAKLIIIKLHQINPSQKNNDCWKSKQYFLALLSHVCISISIILVFLGYLFLKSGEFPQILKLFEYQKIFYNLGFFKIALPTSELHPWMSLLSLYLFGLIISLYTWIYSPANKRMDLIFYLSLLGIGLFFYYQGRSHEFLFIAVTWPGIFIATLLADFSIRAVREKILPAFQILPVAILITILLLTSNCLLIQSKDLINFLNVKINKLSLILDPYVFNEISFIKKFSIGKKECLILSLRQGIYYSESGLVSPINGPGYIETFLKSDQEKLENQVLNGNIKCIFFGIGEDSALDLKINQGVLLNKYKLISTNSIHSMMYFEGIINH